MTLLQFRSKSHRRRSLAAAARAWYDPDASDLVPWTACQAKGAGSQAASYLDLATNGNDLAVGVAPAWDRINGWNFDGTNQYLDTGFVPQNDQSQTLMIQITGTATGGAWAGTFDGATQSLLLMNLVNTGYWVNGGFKTRASGPLSGNLAIAGNTAYIDGSPLSGAIPAWGGAATSSVWIGCANNGDAVLYPVTASIQAIAIWDTVLTTDQVAARAVAMSRL